MAALSKKELEAREKTHGLEAGELTYQQRLQRLASTERGEVWEAPKSTEVRRGKVTSSSRRLSPDEALLQHPLHGKTLLITPMMTPDKDRALYFDEPVGHEIQVEEIAAGKLLYGASADVDRMVGDYKVTHENPSRLITAKTTLPKSGQEITWTIGKDLVPVVRGNDGQAGYAWSLPTHMRQYGDTMIQIHGLRTLLEMIAPELLPRFSGKPVMSYIDGLVLVASIPQTTAILKEYRRKELQDAKLGLV